MNKKVKAKKYLKKEELRAIHLIIKGIYSQLENKEIEKLEASHQLWWNPEIVKWRKRNETELKEMFDEISNVLHPKIINGFEKILTPLVDEGVKIPVVFGTQLGLVREKNLIKWDDDMDVVMDIHDLFDNYDKIKLLSKKNNWNLKMYSSFNKEYEIDGKGSFISKLISNEKITIDFSFFKTKIKPTIDIFHGLRVKDDINLSEINSYIGELFNFYCKEHIDSSRMIINSPNFKKKNLDFWNIVNERKFLKEEIELPKMTRDFHVKDSSSIMIINIATPKLIVGKYYNNETVSLRGLDFLISDNWEEQLENEFGNWKVPYIGQFHFFNLNDIKLKK